MKTNSIRNKIIKSSKILLLDRDPDILKKYTDVLTKKEHKVIAVSDIEKCFDCLQADDIDLLLMEYFVVKDTLDEVISKIREISTRIRIILLFSDKDDVSRHELLETLPVHGCHDKCEGEEKLLIWINTVLKVLTIRDLLHQGISTIKSQVKIIERNKEGLRYIINAMPETISRLQPLDKFIRGILIQLNGFIEADNSFFATIDENEKLILLVGTGDFDIDEKTFLNSQALLKKQKIIDDIKVTAESYIGDNEVYLPLKVKDKVSGIFYIEKKIAPLNELEIEMLRLFASQAAITIENSNLFKLATIDGLTGLFVRRYFLQRFQETLQFASRYGGQALSLLMFDIDHFKNINDTYGHAEGDIVLARVASVIKESVRQTDICGRLGGEEFCVLLIDTDKEEAYIMAEKIRRKVENEVFFLNGERRNVTISIGLSSYASYKISLNALTKKMFSDIAKHDLRIMLTAADKALYYSKENGRNMVSVAADIHPS